MIKRVEGCRQLQDLWNTG